MTWTCGTGPPCCKAPIAYPVTRSSTAVAALSSTWARSGGDANEIVALAKAALSPFLRGSSSARAGGGPAGLWPRDLRGRASAASASASANQTSAACLKFSAPAGRGARSSAHLEALQGPPAAGDVEQVHAELPLIGLDAHQRHGGVHRPDGVGGPRAPGAEIDVEALDPRPAFRDRPVDHVGVAQHQHVRRRRLSGKWLVALERRDGGVA